MLLKEINRLKTKKGFTLVELICTVAIIGILMAAVAALFSPIRVMIGQLHRDAYADTVVQQSVNFIRGELASAKNIWIVSANDTTSISNTTYKHSTDSSSGLETQVRAIYINQNGRVFYYSVPDSNLSGKTPKTLTDNVLKSGDNLSNAAIFPEAYYGNKRFYNYQFSSDAAEKKYIEVKTSVTESATPYTDSYDNNIKYSTPNKEITFSLLDAKSDLKITAPVKNDTSGVLILYTRVAK